MCVRCMRDGVSRDGVLGIVGFHSDYAAIGFQKGVLRAGGLGEPHTFLAALAHLGVGIVHGDGILEAVLIQFGGRLGRGDPREQCGQQRDGEETTFDGVKNCRGTC